MFDWNKIKFFFLDNLIIGGGLEREFKPLMTLGN